MTEIEKTRERKKPQGWQKWLLLFVAVGLLVAAVIQAAIPGRQVGAIACVWLSILVFLQVYRFRDRRSHEELVQEIDALRRELEQLKKTR